MSIRLSGRGNANTTHLHLIIYNWSYKMILGVCCGRRFEILEVEFIADAQEKKCAPWPQSSLENVLHMSGHVDLVLFSNV